MHDMTMNEVVQRLASLEATIKQIEQTRLLRQQEAREDIHRMQTSQKEDMTRVEHVLLEIQTQLARQTCPAPGLCIEVKEETKKMQEDMKVVDAKLEKIKSWVDQQKGSLKMVAVLAGAAGALGGAVGWEYALEFRRDHPLVIQFAAMLQLDAETIFREAALF